MKRVFLAFIVAILLCLFSENAFAANSVFLLGDIDCNDEIDSADARLILRASVKLESFSDDIMQSADIDGNGKVDSADARIVLRIAVGLENVNDYYNEDIYDIYHDIFEMYKLGFKNGFYFDNSSIYSNKELVQDDYKDRMGHCPNPNLIIGRVTQLYYTFFDINKDGIPELLFSRDNDNLCDAFGYENGTAYRLFGAYEMHNRSRFYICKNGIIVNEGSAGAFAHRTGIYCLPNNSANPDLLYDLYQKNKDEYFQQNNEESIPITEREYNDIISQFLEILKLPWKTLSRAYVYQTETSTVEYGGPSAVKHEIVVTDCSNDFVSLYYRQSGIRHCPVFDIKRDGTPSDFEWTDNGSMHACTVSYLESSIILSFKTDDESYRIKEFDNLELKLID